MNFDQILTKSDQILTIYVKNHQIHVKQIQECHFLKIKKNPTLQINQDLGEIGVLGYIWGCIRGELIN